VTANRDFDLVLLGATGFTGALTAAHLARRVGGRPWAIAGRDLARLDAIRAQLAPFGTLPGVLHADVTDEGSLRDLAASTRVLATTVGPYARLGEPVVRACVAEGTEYADITGEAPFVDRVRRDHDAAALDAGTRIVNCCGFDSIPHDLAVHHAVSVLPDDEAVAARGYVRIRGQASGGTAHSAVGIMREGNGPSVPRRGDAGRRVRGATPRPGRVEDPRGFAVPMPTIDPAVVLRSAAMLGQYGPDFTYAHHLVLPSPVVAAGLGAGVGLLAALARIPGGDRVLDRVLPDPGTGPAPGRRARSSFSVTVHAEAAGGARSRAVVSGGDAGYEETAVMLGETALGLLDDDVELRPGVVTPAVALGDALRQRLVAQGQVHEVELLS
jgi:short subunit dehydrogenase-like uncharacterized protein